MLNLEQILEAMADRNVSEVARRIGISRQALYRVVNGDVKPRYETLVKLSEYFTTVPSRPDAALQASDADGKDGEK